MMNDRNKRKGIFGRVIDALVAWDNAMDYTPYAYVLDRVRNLEREVFLLRDELRALRALNNAGAHAQLTSSSPAVAR